MLIRSQPLLSEKIYLLGLVLIAIGLPTSVFVMSLGGITLFCSWILQGNYAEALKISFKNKSVQIIVALFALHLVGLIWTEDFKYAFNDIKVKLPLLLYPVIVYAMPSLNKRNFHSILTLYILATLVSSLISYGVYLEIIPTSKDLSDIRNISPFISHIRLSLMICLGFILCIYFIIMSKSKSRFALIAVAIWFLYFLLLIESITALIILAALLFLVNIYLLVKSKNKWIKLGGGSVFVLVIGYFLLISTTTYLEIRTPKENLNALDKLTAHGEPYVHDLSNNRMENGYYVSIYQAPQELKKAWNERATIKFDSLDKKNQFIGFTLSRYLTSKGLRKDYDGVYALTQDDIFNIENGIANINYVTKKGLSRRIERLIFELESYVYGDNISKNSVVRRIIFWQNGWKIFKQNMIIGVGTGDAQVEFNKAYATSPIKLDPNEWKRSHNQFLAMMVSFGMVGLVFFLAFIFYPMYVAIKKKNYLYFIFSILVFISYFTEDTLESQPGITFIMYFTCLLLFITPSNLFPTKK